tara:strand:- start:102 stop:347 length:246 start_codon:yes stop_codon:yes gene_type:complete
LNITGDQLAKFYGVSGARIRYLRGKGAPVENPHAFFEWWKEHQGRHGFLYWTLFDRLTREDLRRQIDNLISINERSKSQPC